MPIDDPGALVEKFKKSGEFERLRHELLLEFQKDESYATFKGRIEEIVRQQLAKAQMLHYLPPEMVNKELGQEIERSPAVKRAVTEMKTFFDPGFLSDIKNSLQNVLRSDALAERSSSEQKKRKREEDTEDKPLAARGAGPATDHDPDSAMSVDKSCLSGHSPSRTKIQAEGDPDLTMKSSGNQTSNPIVVPSVSTSHHKTDPNQTKLDDAMDVDN